MTCWWYPSQASQLSNIHPIHLVDSINPKHIVPSTSSPCDKRCKIECEAFLVRLHRLSNPSARNTSSLIFHITVSLFLSMQSFMSHCCKNSITICAAWTVSHQQQLWSILPIRTSNLVTDVRWNDWCLRFWNLEFSSLGFWGRFVSQSLFAKDFSFQHFSFSLLLPLHVISCGKITFTMLTSLGCNSNERSALHMARVVDL